MSAAPAPLELLSFPCQPPEGFRQGGHIREEVKVEVDHPQEGLDLLDGWWWGAVKQGLDVLRVRFHFLSADDVAEELHFLDPKAALVWSQPEVGRLQLLQHHLEALVVSCLSPSIDQDVVDVEHHPRDPCQSLCHQPLENGGAFLQAHGKSRILPQALGGHCGGQMAGFRVEEDMEEPFFEVQLGEHPSPMKLHQYILDSWYGVGFWDDILIEGLQVCSEADAPPPSSGP